MIETISCYLQGHGFNNIFNNHRQEKNTTESRILLVQRQRLKL